MRKNSSFGDRVVSFYKHLKAPIMPVGIEVMMPYKDRKIIEITEKFYSKFFSDNHKRIFVFGINPGRFGAGITGVTFSDPIALEDYCGIANDFAKYRELSSIFVYDFISQWGSPEKFYSDFFLTAVCPLGFTKNGKNYNYYDDKKLYEAAQPFIVKTLRQQVDIGATRRVAMVFGMGQNMKCLKALNEEHDFFDELLCLEHPRFIMQYRRKYLADYIKKYRDVFSKALMSK